MRRKRSDYDVPGCLAAAAERAPITARARAHEAAELLAEGRDRAEARLRRDALDGVVGGPGGLLRVARLAALARRRGVGTRSRDELALARLRRWISELPRR